MFKKFEAPEQPQKPIEEGQGKMEEESRFSGEEHNFWTEWYMKNTAPVDRGKLPLVQFIEGRKPYSELPPEERDKITPQEFLEQQAASIDLKNEIIHFLRRQAGRE